MLKSVVLAAFLTCGAMSAYAQTTPSQHGSAPAATPADRPAVDRTVSTGDFNAKGDMAASALIGTKVRNANKESIGKIDDIYLDKDAKVTDVVVSVGGFLGVGSKDVAVKWSDITIGQEDNSVVLTTSLTKEALMALPDYTKTERRKPAPPETAAAPPARPTAPREPLDRESTKRGAPSWGRPFLLGALSSPRVAWGGRLRRRPASDVDWRGCGPTGSAGHRRRDPCRSGSGCRRGPGRPRRDGGCCCTGRRRWERRRDRDRPTRRRAAAAAPAAGIAVRGRYRCDLGVGGLRQCQRQGRDGCGCRNYGKFDRSGHVKVSVRCCGKPTHDAARGGVPARSAPMTFLCAVCPQPISHRYVACPHGPPLVLGCGA